ncbi:MAG: AAA family ATPase [Nitrospiria bacterium]
MFIEFNVTNFRSIRETQTLSMVSSKYYKGLEETNCFDSGLPGFSKLLRSAAIYGPNAAGKSNLLRAIHFMQSFILLSHSHQEGQMINVAPFAISSNTRTEPSEFEIFFVQDNIRYQYGFEINKTRVTKEWLSAYPEGKAQRWYERTYDPGKDNEEWYFGSKFTGRRQLWQDATRKNALFLSTAIQLNSEQLKPVFNWFQQRLAVILPDGQIDLQISIDQCASDEGKKRILEFMNSADISISGIEVKKIKFTPEMVPLGVPQVLRDQIVQDMLGKDMNAIRFQHQATNGESVYFEMNDESHGTQRLFAFAGPWLDILAKAKIIFVDELDTGFHPLMVRYLINLIQNQDTNKNDAQLIFTTHDTSILDTELFRRDQVWFVEKDRENASKIYPLSDFNPRKGEALEKGYLKGRYGALPYIDIENFRF